MNTIDQSHLVTHCHIQGAHISTNAWVNEDNTVISLIDITVRNTQCSAEINLWPKSTDEVQAIIDTLTQHIKNVQAKELEKIANAGKMIGSEYDPRC